ncbi:uncharacterized protein GGS22DRAFT_187865 [Annulohypoxylon maeteangense]|uniref:uncharacterized protein n=1 Tax=Annulohypoxylon maeteangense TaxID=1927788 RepID=UPI0020084360|nr:uncharacterized protein GGS22DRAFT_187865 [Annulohypoxylon maeteangense]KAI0885580.1 hypothetical protein GGS22DRAFT_187865 [Annulohypoxylon maeteangense]
MAPDDHNQNDRDDKSDKASSGKPKKSRGSKGSKTQNNPNQDSPHNKPITWTDDADRALLLSMVLNSCGNGQRRKSGLSKVSWPSVADTMRAIGYSISKDSVNQRFLKHIIKDAQKTWPGLKAHHNLPGNDQADNGDDIQEAGGPPRQPIVQPRRPPHGAPSHTGAPNPSNMAPHSYVGVPTYNPSNPMNASFHGVGTAGGYTANNEQAPSFYGTHGMHPSMYPGMQPYMQPGNGQGMQFGNGQAMGSYPGMQPSDGNMSHPENASMPLLDRSGTPVPMHGSRALSIRSHSSQSMRRSSTPAVQSRSRPHHQHATGDDPDNSVGSIYPPPPDPNAPMPDPYNQGRSSGGGTATPHNAGMQFGGSYTQEYPAPTPVQQQQHSSIFGGGFATHYDGTPIAPNLYMEPTGPQFGSYQQQGFGSGVPAPEAAYTAAQPAQNRPMFGMASMSAMNSRGNNAPIADMGVPSTPGNGDQSPEEVRANILRTYSPRTANNIIRDMESKVQHRAGQTKRKGDDLDPRADDPKKPKRDGDGGATA